MQRARFNMECKRLWGKIIALSYWEARVISSEMMTHIAEDLRDVAKDIDELNAVVKLEGING